MENSQINPMNPQMPPVPEAEKSQAGTNLAIVILVLVIVVVGVKLLMSGTSANVPVSEEGATGAESVATTTAETVVSETTSPMPEAMPGKGQVVFSIVSPKAIFVREILVHNPYKIGAEAWVRVYDGYKSVSAGSPTEIFTVSLATIMYDMVKVGFIDAASALPDETIKNMTVAVSGQEKTMVQIDL